MELQEDFESLWDGKLLRRFNPTEYRFCSRCEQLGLPRIHRRGPKMRPYQFCPSRKGWRASTPVGPKPDRSKKHSSRSFLNSKQMADIEFDLWEGELTQQEIAAKNYVTQPQVSQIARRIGMGGGGWLRPRVGRPPKLLRRYNPLQGGGRARDIRLSGMGRKRIPRMSVCQVTGCEIPTTGNKPYCIKHIDQMPYVSSMSSGLDEDLDVEEFSENPRNCKCSCRCC